MSFFNYTTKEIVLKIVYYGPGLCGKTTNVKHIYSATNDDTRGKLISLETQQERTLYFDFLPIELPEIRGFKTRLHLYTVPGQLFYSNSRRLIMKGADGVVFVADSQADRLEANLISMDDLLDNLRDLLGCGALREFLRDFGLLHGNFRHGFLNGFAHGFDDLLYGILILSGRSQ